MFVKKQRPIVHYFTILYSFYGTSMNLEHVVAMKFLAWHYCVTDMSVHVSTCTSYNFSALTPIVWKLWHW